jgi:hypothetical protein
MEPKRKPQSDAVLDDGASGARPARTDRPVTRPTKKGEAALETYEQPARRGGDEARGELSRQPDDMERPTRDEP